MLQMEVLEELLLTPFNRTETAFQTLPSLVFLLTLESPS